MKCISHAGNAAKQWTYSQYSYVATYCSYTAQLILQYSLILIKGRNMYDMVDIQIWQRAGQPQLYGVLRLERVGVKSPAIKTFTRHVA